MNHLLRDKAPISDAAWAEVDDEASRTLKHFLAARKLIDFSGPHGWDFSGVPTGRVDDAGSLEGGAVQARTRSVQPMVELRTPFALSRAELDAFDRGACDGDLQPLIDAARAAAFAEDGAIFNGFEAGGLTGIASGSPVEPVLINDDYQRYPRFVAVAMARLKDAGIEGPYTIALGPRCYTGVIEQSEMGGYPVLEHLRLILGGPVVYAPAVDGAVVLSQRGGDFELVSGQDLAIGYLSHDGEAVQLYFEESFTLRNCTPEAAVALRYGD